MECCRLLPSHSSIHGIEEQEDYDLRSTSLSLEAPVLQQTVSEELPSRMAAVHRPVWRRSGGISNVHHWPVPIGPLAAQLNAIAPRGTSNPYLGSLDQFDRSYPILSNPIRSIQIKYSTDRSQIRLLRDKSTVTKQSFRGNPHRTDLRRFLCNPSNAFL